MSEAVPVKVIVNVSVPTMSLYSVKVLQDGELEAAVGRVRVWVYPISILDGMISSLPPVLKS